MYVVFDYQCILCGQHSERLVVRDEMDAQTHDECAGRLLSDPPQAPPMLRLPAGSRTTFRFADRKLKP